eukprot:TRINITY_DN3691_c0_g1_i5.p2 TRINITY_DN3691_c0_g1~~TRINITY_DN3691_c0_g1_i5.p2  ORF type:complete len:114 (-),score=26.28 TRINITY_DN3691_c0_g1_i5:425-766(-)
MGKGSRWEECESVARAWISTSDDPTRGADMTADKFWECSKFSSLYFRVTGEEHSGWTEDDYINESLKRWVTIELAKGKNECQADRPSQPDAAEGNPNGDDVEEGAIVVDGTMR